MVAIKRIGNKTAKPSASVKRMITRSRLVSVLVVLTCLHGCGARFSPENLTGAWQGVRDDSAVVTVTFYADKNLQLVITDKEGQSRIVEGKFETDFSKSPIPLSIRNIPQLSHPLHTLIEIKDVDTIRLGAFAPRWRLRPLSFSPETEVWLSRQVESDAHPE